jgi:cytidine deaminase
MNPSDPTDRGEPSDVEARLLAAAWEIRGGALCTYSNFAVGAALLDSEGRTWTGANVENASYTLGLCAERVAIFYALAHGARDFKYVVVTTGAAEPTSPCGACRQILHEFAPDAVVLSALADGRLLRTSVRELLPFGFDATSLTRRA